MLAEAQAQQEGPDLAEFLEVAFVVVAVAEAVEVQRLGEDVGDPVAGDVRGEGAAKARTSGFAGQRSVR